MPWMLTLYVEYLCFTGVERNLKIGGVDAESRKGDSLTKINSFQLRDYRYR
jgi:hypothetical protein